MILPASFEQKELEDLPRKLDDLRSLERKLRRYEDEMRDRQVTLYLTTFA